MAKRGIYDTYEMLKYRLREVDWLDFLQSEYGIQHVTVDGPEIRHSCVLPFGNHRHGDRNPSASFNVEKLSYNCYVCGGGGLLWFIMSMEDCDEQEAINKLRSLVNGDDITTEQLVLELEGLMSEEKGSSKELPIYPKSTLEAFEIDAELLLGKGFDENVFGGLTAETLEFFQVGYNENERRVIIPHFFEGELRGWQGRRTKKSEKPKYKNTTGFPRRETLFNWDNAQGYSEVFVVEAPLSAMWMSQCGFPNTVATFGSEVTEEQIALLRRFGGVVTFLDDDEAGLKGTKRIVDNLKGPLVMIVEHEGVNDPKDLGKDELVEYCMNRVTLSSLYSFDRSSDFERAVRRHLGHPSRHLRRG